MTLRAVVQRLEAAGIPDAFFEASEIICAATGRSRAAVMTEEFSGEDVEKLLSRRIEGEPLQYILGSWEFMGCPIKVSPDCLIPRADTEVLAELAIKSLPRGGRFADLCTGSGCIAVSVLYHRTDVTGVAAELYEKTADIAKENAVLNGVDDRLEIICADVMSDCLEGKFDVIVSNPPYVTAEEMKTLSKEVLREPHHALTDGGDGLSIIRKIIELYPKHLNRGGMLGIEIGWQQGLAVRRIALENGLGCEVIKDSGGRDRVAWIKGEN